MPDPGSVSICIPVYNGRNTVAETLASAFNQTCMAAEVLLVDNASTDGTPAIAAQFTDRGLVVHRNGTNLGFNGNFNRAVQLARNKYIVILSADDLLYPDFIGRMAGLLERNQGAGFAFSAADLLDPAGGRIGTQKAGFDAGRINGDAFLEQILLRAHPVILSCTMFHRERLLATGGFNEQFTNSDFIVQAQLASQYDVCYSGEILGGYRVVPDCTGELELYGKPDLLTKKLAMLEYLFHCLDGRYAAFRRKAEKRWLVFTENYLAFSSFRYGRRHAAALARDILRNRPWHILSPRFLAAFMLSVVLPQGISRALILAAAKLLHKDGVAIRRNLGARGKPRA